MTAEHLIAELADPSCYGVEPANLEDAVEIVQTHLSVVCLVGDRVYKLKKAMRLSFVDFSTLSLRRAVCREEVRLNRRLCPDVYLGTAALRRTAGSLRFAAVGDDEGPDDVDTAVVMRRLPRERMLDVLLAAGGVSTGEIEALARQMAAFHAAGDRGPAVRDAGSPLRLAGFAAANYDEVQAVRDHGLPQTLLGAMAAASARDFAALLPILERRLTAGHVVDGHGDLHARNICMTEPPVAYDCIEFEPAFRCGDVATENAFLVMDLRYRGARVLADAYVSAYMQASGDFELPELLPTLCAYRAMVRAKVGVLAAGETEMPAADRAASRISALRHVLLAAALTIEGRTRSSPIWLVCCGPPASGKSSLCRELVVCAEWPHMATDIVRKELAGLLPTERGDASIYGAAFSDRTYDEVLRRAAATTAAGASVVLIDGNFATVARRSQASAVAVSIGATAWIVHVDVNETVALQRASAREREPGNVSDAGRAEAARLRQQFVAPTEVEPERLVTLDGAANVRTMVGALFGILVRRV